MVDIGAWYLYKRKKYLYQHFSGFTSGKNRIIIRVIDSNSIIVI